MKRYDNIDYSFRPSSYFRDKSVIQALLRDVKGTQRRKMIERAFVEGVIEDLPDEFHGAKLGTKSRAALEAIHPWFMGGEYLPDVRSGETEIVRIELKSTTGDVISVRARVTARGWAYSAADEYESEFKIALETSRETLTLGQLIHLIDHSQHGEYEPGLAMCYNWSNHWDGCNRADLRHFTTVSSTSYPQISEHYDHVFAEWVKEETEAWEADRRS